MLILLSPAKTMVGSSRTTVPFVTVPLYKSEAEHIAMEMAGYSVEELSGMLGINRNLALQTKERYNVFHSPDVHGLPALLAYTGFVTFRRPILPRPILNMLRIICVWHRLVTD